MQCEIAVVGNGAIGKAAALSFAQAGFKVVLLAPSEAAMTMRAMTADWDARVFALNQTAKSLLQKLKVWDALDQTRIAPIEAMRVSDVGSTNNGRRQEGVLSLDAYTAYQSELAFIVEDQNLNQALDNAIRFSPHITLLAGKALAMSPDFSHLNLAGGKTLQSELWVAADGAQSWMRYQADIGYDCRSYGQRGVVANFSCTKPHHNVAHQWFAGKQGIIALLPLPGNQVSLVWSAPEDVAQSLLREDLHQLAKKVMTYCEGELGALIPLPPQKSQAFPLQFISPHRIIGKQLALVVDAAHQVHPLAGHGMNLGFGDVTALLDAVVQREPWRSCGDERVLKRYARARKEEVMFMQLATDGLSRLFSLPLAPVEIARKVGMNVINRSSFLKRKLMNHAIGQ